MADQIDLQQLPDGQANGAAAALELEHLAEIPMELSVELGRTYLTVGEALALDVGSIITLERTAGDPADLLVNGTPVARGEVVVVDERFGLRITEILDAGKEQLASENGQAAEPAAEP